MIMILLNDVGFPAYITLIILLSGIFFAIFWLIIIILFCRLKAKRLGKLKRQPAFFTPTRENDDGQFYGEEGSGNNAKNKKKNSLYIPNKSLNSNLNGAKVPRKFDNMEYSSIDMETSGVQNAMEMANVRMQERQELLEEQARKLKGGPLLLTVPQTRFHMVSPTNSITPLLETNTNNEPDEKAFLERNPPNSENNMGKKISNFLQFNRGQTDRRHSEVSNYYGANAKADKKRNKSVNDIDGVNNEHITALINIVPTSPTITPLTFVLPKNSHHKQFPNLSGLPDIPEDESNLSSASTETSSNLMQKKSQKLAKDRNRASHKLVTLIDLNAKKPPSDKDKGQPIPVPREDE
ncbi:unnamed protein product [Gordionus sp. m RMFG-2023]